jgi:4-hydroxy-4-methyl-2-oxoglutarate aldolase
MVYSVEKTEEFCGRLEKIFVPAVADVLDGMGVRGQCLPAGYWPVLPGSVAAGPAFTVREAAAAGDEPRTTQEKMRIFTDFFGALGRGQIVVVDTGGCHDAAAWGELMSTITYYTCGSKAAVVNGAIRDVSRIVDIKFPVWYKDRVPADSEGRLQLLEFNRPMRCDGVAVNPGDLVFADPDGVVILPMDGSVDVEAVIARAEHFVELENKTRADLRKGVAVVDVFNKYGRL